jgi:hypothetical protein
MNKRRLSSDEKRLLVALIERSGQSEVFMTLVDSMWVEEMNDGGMGSLNIFLESAPNASRTMKSQAAELQFTDADGAVVIASLNVSEDGYPYEIDVWKTTFDPLIRIPEEFMDVLYGEPKPSESL